MAAKDITRPETLTNIRKDDEGTGIYWFVSPAAEYEQVFVPAIKRQRAEELAADFAFAGKQKLDAYRWVPDKHESAQALIAAPCAGTSCKTDLDCVDNACRCI